MTTGSLTMRLAIIAISVPFFPEPTTPKDLTAEKLKKDLNIIRRFLM